MTPPGVEHMYVADPVADCADVPIPMTPPGVEHRAIVATDRESAVPIPMTPPGVEHIVRLSVDAERRRRADSNDAARR